jgi:hypothetical protein
MKKSRVLRTYTNLQIKCWNSAFFYNYLNKSNGGGWSLKGKAGLHFTRLGYPSKFIHVVLSHQEHLTLPIHIMRELNFVYLFPRKL